MRTLRSMFHTNDVPASIRARRKPSLDFSMTGLVYICMTLFMGLAAMNTKASLLFGVFGLMLGVLLISWLLSQFVLRKLSVRRVLPDHAVVGQAAPVAYDFTNAKKRLPSLSVSLAEMEAVEAFAKHPFSYLLHAAAGTTATVPGELLPRRRGMHTLDTFQLSTSFPFGFIKRAILRTGTRDTLIVYPPLGTVDQRLMRLCRAADQSGAMMRPRGGGMDEFYGLKEYRPGESPRWIYWRRSARTGVLVSKEMTRVAPPRLLLIMDTFIPPDQRTLEAHAHVERCIAMAGTLASRALEDGLMVGVFAWADRWVHIPPNRGKRQRRDVLTQLARLPLNPGQPTEDLVAAARAAAEPGSTMILFTPQEPDGGSGTERLSAGAMHGGLLTINARGRQANAWFRFDESAVDFRRCMPMDQDPALPDPAIRAGGRNRP